MEADIADYEATMRDNDHVCAAVVVLRRMRLSLFWRTDSFTGLCSDTPLASSLAYSRCCSCLHVCHCANAFLEQVFADQDRLVQERKSCVLVTLHLLRVVGLDFPEPEFDPEMASLTRTSKRRLNFDV